MAMDQRKFLQQLQIVLDPSKGNVKTATNVLQNEFYKRPDALLFLIQLVISHDSADLKQLSAIQARPLVSKQWTKLPAQQRQQARTQLLQATASEDSTIVRHAASRLVGAIAKVEIEDGEWPELPAFLQQAATSSKKEERAVGVYLLFSILETMGDGFSAKFKDLFTLFSKTIRDAESFEVRINTMLALSRMAIVIDAEEDQQSVKAFQGIFPSMVAVLKDAIDQNDAERVMQAFEVFQTLLGCEYQLMSKHFQDFIVFMMQIAANTEMPEDTRIQAISFLMQSVQYRRLKIQGMKIGEQLTLAMLQIVTELGDDAVEDDEITPARSALGLIDSMAQQLPASQVIVPLLKVLPQYTESSEAIQRRAGILALGMCVEGAPDFVGTQVPEILPYLLRLLDDPEVPVRQAALHSTARLADDVPADFTKVHEKLMPMLFKNLTAAMQAYSGEESGPNINIMKAACSAIDAVVDGMDPNDAKLYLDKLAPLLQKLFKHPDLKIKALAASALGSLASTVEEPFIPYLDDSMHAMQEYVAKKESEDELELRASVTDAMGEMAVAVGPEKFKQYVPPLMQASEEALNLDHSRLKESTYILWGSLAKVYEEEFSPFLAGVIKGLFECLNQEEADLEVELGDNAKDLLGKEVTIAGRKVKVAAAEDDDDEHEDGDIEDVEIDGDEDEWDDLTTIGPMALEKEIAIEVLGDVISNTKSAYLPYFEKTIENILPLTEHAYEAIRKATISTLHRAFASLWDVSEEEGQMEHWKPGLPLQVQPPAELKKFGELLMTATMSVWEDEDDRATVTDTSRSLSATLQSTGPFLLSLPDVLQNVIAITTSIITRKHPCQEDLLGDDSDPDLSDMESTEFDWLVVDAGLDVIAGLAVALGPSFAELWEGNTGFAKHVLRFASSGEAGERASAMGVLAEVITGLKEGTTPFTPQLMQVLLKRLDDEEPQVKSNAAYAMGRLVEGSQDAATVGKAYPAILGKLEGLFSIEEGRCRDNAAGCVGRLVLKHHDQVPLEQVLPALVTSGVLPLKEDYEENTPVWGMVVQLYKWQDATIQRLTPQLAPIMMSALGEPEEQLTDETRAELQALVEHLSQS